MARPALARPIYGPRRRRKACRLVFVFRAGQHRIALQSHRRPSYDFLLPMGVREAWAAVGAPGFRAEDNGHEKHAKITGHTGAVRQAAAA